MTSSEHVTTAQAAERFGVTVRTIARWVEAGVLTPAIKFPGERGPFLFTEAEVKRFADERAEQARATA
jgi:excisionase family DNA binding protein